jgi:hypothetical protein
MKFPTLLFSLLVPLTAYAGANGGSCTGNVADKKMCFDYSKVSATSEICMPGFQYSPGKCNTSGSNGYCATGPINTYYWDTSSTAKEVCSLQGGTWKASSASSANDVASGPVAASGAVAGAEQGYSVVNGSCMTQDGRPASNASLCKSGAEAATSGGKGQLGKQYRSSGGNGNYGRATAQVTGGVGGRTQENGSDSCWDASRCSVIVKSQKWSKDHDEYTIVFLSTCKDRVYAKFGLEQIGGNWSSGADGIAPGKTASWNAFNATGKARIKWVGVSKAEDDWVCAGKVSNWNED